MTKDPSRASSVTGSVHHENGDEPPRQPQSGGLSPHVSHPAPIPSTMADAPKVAAASVEIAAPSPAPAAPVEALSQPMTASNSSSSNQPPSDMGTYGTRSRNRGAARPNYAEDKELETEFDVIASPKESNGRKGTKTAEGTNLEAAQANIARKGAILEADANVLLQNYHKEPIPGTLTFPANPAPISGQSSKKRKATNQSTPNASLQPQQYLPMNGLPAAQANTRRASMAAHAAGGFRESNMMSFEGCGSRLKNKKLVADDGTVLQTNDHVFLVCEPPGEAYYLGRIMEFLHTNNDSRQPIDALRLNWYYRPKDIGRSVNDTRQVFASMHSDISPLTALRGKCFIKHRSEVDNLDELRRARHTFWYEKLYDRYIHRYYDVVPTSQVINVPLVVKKVLDERWKYIIVETGRAKELTSAVKTCKRCSKYCASNDSVDCAVCKNTYHMSCVSPPLLKKPSRGFAWACGPCSKAQEQKLAARNTPNVHDVVMEGEEDEIADEEEDLSGASAEVTEAGQTNPPRSAEVSIKPGTAEQIHQASLWQFRYLGIHCNVEDALDYDDRIYPRASSRLGPRHQANIPSWPGRPIEYVKPVEIKKKYTKGGQKKDSKLPKETVAAMEADKAERERRPKWVMDEPVGYVHRGQDHHNASPNSTAKLMFRLPEVGEISGLPQRGMSDYQDDALIGDREMQVKGYMARVKTLATSLGLPSLSTNLLDVALDLYNANGYNAEDALQALFDIDVAAYREPLLTPAEIKKFEDGVTKFGSEWHSIKKHVKTVSAANIVRFYYVWKKTDRGKRIWGSYTGRKAKKEAKKAETTTTGKLQDDVADDYDDSAFDNDKAFEKKRGFQCKFCATRSSRQWRRAPNTPAGSMILEATGAKATSKDKGNLLMVALCQRCAQLWRYYAVQWEDIDEASKKSVPAAPRQWKRKVDEELLKEIEAADLEESAWQLAHAAPMVPALEEVTPAAFGLAAEPPRKKVKGAPDQDLTDQVVAPIVVQPPKKKVPVEKPYVPPPPPEPPKAKLLPCAICSEFEPKGDQLLICKDCRMTVHRNCYGVVGEHRSSSKWSCDPCTNDKNPQVSVNYMCMLCPIYETEVDFVEAPRSTHKKKNDKDREREKVEKEKAQADADYFTKKQLDANKPKIPREPLKRTANNNWVHATCAVFTPEVKFGNAKALEPSEGIPSIPSSKYDEICKGCKQLGGACVNCHHCRATWHVECARQYPGATLGFDITPVKGSRRDHTNVVTIGGETGTMSAVVWCREHIPTKTIVHRIQDLVEGTDLNALQLYVQNFKQADLTLTGTVRKANLVNQSTKFGAPATVTALPNRRASTIGASTRGAASHAKQIEPASPASATKPIAKSCVTCDIDVSPKWWPVLPPQPPQPSPPAQLSPSPPFAQQTLPSAQHSGSPEASASTHGENSNAIGSPTDIDQIMKDSEPMDGNTDNSANVNAEKPTNGHVEMAATVDTEMTANGDTENTINGTTQNEEGHQVALAVAALHEEPPSEIPSHPPPPPAPTEFQCHKCHCKKVPVKEPTPTPTPSPMPAFSTPRESTQPTQGHLTPAPQRESSLPSQLLPEATPDVPIPSTDDVEQTSEYSYPQAPSYPSPPTYNSNANPPASSYNGNGWPNQFPVGVPGVAIHRLGVNPPPQLPNGASYSSNGQEPVRQSMQNALPRENSHGFQPPNGYRPGSPPRRSMSTGFHTQNAPYAAYAAARNSPHLLTNGGPPPRAQEHFRHSSQPHTHFGSLHGSPTMNHESFSDASRERAREPARESSDHSQSQSREFGSAQNNGANDSGRSQDGRVNGGASASPSLRNLLS